VKSPGGWESEGQLRIEERLRALKMAYAKGHYLPGNRLWTTLVP
jgi:hypothetical protein